SRQASLLTFGGWRAPWLPRTRTAEKDRWFRNAKSRTPYQSPTDSASAEVSDAVPAHRYSGNHTATATLATSSSRTRITFE
ncbi:uncharacterized protein BO80DRAFT_388638, partial [Aspergillus ibericus CBS 121593]